MRSHPLQVLIGSLREYPIEHSLDHHHEDDEQHEVAVDVGVVVTLLLLVQAHLDGMIQFSDAITHYPLLLYQGF